jgi:hypothetical protein
MEYVLCSHKKISETSFSVNCGIMFYHGGTDKFVLK